MDHAKLKEVEEKQEGYGYQIKHNTLYLTIEPQLNQTIQLTLPVEKNSFDRASTRINLRRSDPKGLCCHAAGNKGKTD